MTTEHARDFGSLLRRHRRAAGLTQEALAAQAGLSTRGIQDLERGVSRTPRSTTVGLLVEALGLTEEEEAELTLFAAGPTPPSDGPVHARANLPSSLVPLVGRRAEIAILEQFLGGKCGAAGAVPLLLLAGEPGIGKTRLLQAAVQRAVRHGWTVLVGGCHRHGGQGPYSPLIEALAGYLHSQTSARLAADLEGCTWLVRLLPELSPALEPMPAGTFTPEQERRLLFAAVARVLTNTAGPRGTLLVLDDLQWAGPDALDLLATLVRNSDIPLHVVGGYRDTDVRPGDPLDLLMGDLAQAGLVRRQALGPLSDAEAAALLGDLLVGAANADPAVTGRVLRYAGGTPFFLVSYAQALAAGSRESVPWDLAQGVRQRVALLPEAARAILRVAAIAGRRVTRALLTTVAGQSEEEVLIGLEEACQARLLLEEGDQTYAFGHDVVREVVEADISAARRAVLHRRVARALEEQPTPALADLLAYHYGRSDVPANAVPFLDQAGDQAWAQGAHGAAERHYRSLLDQLELLGRADEALRAREKLANVLYETGHYGAAVSMLESVVDGLAADADWTGLARATARIGWAHWRGGTTDEGIARIEGLLAVLNRHHEQPPPTLYAALGLLLFGAGRYSESLGAIELASERAHASGDARTRALADAQLINILYILGRVEDALRVGEALFSEIEWVEDLDTLRLAHGGLADIRILRGELAAARHHVDRARTIGERIGDPASLAFPLTLGAWIDTVAGDWRSARTGLERALDLSDRVQRWWYAPYPRIFLTRLFLAEGAWEAAAVEGNEALALGERSGDLQAVRWVAPSMAELDVRAGRPEAAVARLTPLLDRPGLEECDVTSLLPVLAWAQLEMGQAEQAATTVEQALTRTRREDLRLVLVETLWVQARISMHQERLADAARHVQEGLALARDIPYPYGEARLLRVDGQRHATLGERAAAGERLAGALAIFRRLGARRDAAEVKRSLVVM